MAQGSRDRFRPHRGPDPTQLMDPPLAAVTTREVMGDARSGLPVEPGTEHKRRRMPAAEQRPAPRHTTHHTALMTVMTVHLIPFRETRLCRPSGVQTAAVAGIFTEPPPNGNPVRVASQAHAGLQDHAPNGVGNRRLPTTSAPRTGSVTAFRHLAGGRPGGVAHWAPPTGAGPSEPCGGPTPAPRRDGRWPAEGGS